MQVGTEFWAWQIAADADSLTDEGWCVPELDGENVEFSRSDACEEARDSGVEEDNYIYVRKAQYTVWPSTLGCPVSADYVYQEAEDRVDELGVNIQRLEGENAVTADTSVVQLLQSKLDAAWHEWVNRSDVKVRLIKFLSEPERVED